jgi:glucose/arabinose dehydrogenase/mono/diheme cytochrome c family protein
LQPKETMRGRQTKRAFLVVLAGLAAALANAPAQEIRTTVLAMNATWRYNHADCLDGVSWTAPDYNDSGPNWLAGLGGFTGGETRVEALLGVSTTTLPAPGGTRGGRAFYFRTRFTLGSVANVSLIFSNRLDDNAAFYLNGQLVQRVRLNANPIQCLSFGDITPHANNDAVDWDVFTLSPAQLAGVLVPGTNTLAVEVHQNNATSSDMVFALSLTASVPDPNPPSTVRMPLEPPTFGYRLTNAFGSLTFTDPVAIATPPGETHRLFVVEQAGRIAVITNLAAPNRTVFLDIAARIVAGGEQGLLGLAFHPGYASNRQFYIFYTVNATSAQGTNTLHDRLSMMLASAANPNAADAASEVILLEQRDEAGNHNGGDLHFGPDGYLYVALGDEGGGNDQYNNSQRIDKDFFAGLLRIDVDNRPESLLPNPHPANTNNLAGTIRYRIPPDNPWVGATTFNGAAVNPAALRTEFYAVGLRNPWRFSFDRVTGDLYLADVGQNLYEEVNLVRPGGNYGWSYREGLHPGPRGNPPAGVVFDQPIVEYTHGNGPTQGFSVTGGLVYRGSRLPALEGAYLFADYVSGHVWMLQANGTNVVPFTRLTTDAGIAGFGLDPSNGDVLTADQSDDTIKRLVEDPSVLVGQPLPPTLWHTGAFTNLMALSSATDPLTPNTGVFPYDVNVPAWSDHAHKTRWFFRANTNLTFGFSRDGNWSFPTGTVWVQHFDLEMTNGVPASARRVETRLLVKNDRGAYGVTYRWGGSLTNATLVPDEGLDETFTIDEGGSTRTQTWRYPGRSECMTCHTPEGGFALGFNTAQLNLDFDRGAGPTNQVTALGRAGYFSAPVSNLNLLPALAAATNAAWSREWRVRSYLAVNCAPCHQPGGSALGTWDARYHNPLSASGLIRGALFNDNGDTNNRVVVPGMPAHSMLLTRIATRGPGQMPPLGTSLLDPQALALVQAWIGGDLAGYRTFPEWQTDRFGSTNAPMSGPEEDADDDGAENFLEWLTGTDPQMAGDAWRIGIAAGAGALQILAPQLANRGFEVQRAGDLSGAAWTPLDVPANRPVFSPTNRLMSVEDAPTNAPGRFYRVRVFEP